MKLYLFGGAEIDDVQPQILKGLINNILVEIKPKQLLHIPFARLEVPRGEEKIWGEGWVKRDLNLQGIELLDGRKNSDLLRASKPAIFINGGPQRDQLFEKITSDKLLYDLVMNADYIIGESSGAMVLAEYRVAYRNEKAVITKGLGILKDTIIEAHYTQRNRQKVLREEIKESGAKYGIGIDSITGIAIDTKTYPEKYKVLGSGLVELVRQND